jgi:peptidyl-prolyl cis-trans isomerase C
MEKHLNQVADVMRPLTDLLSTKLVGPITVFHVLMFVILRYLKLQTIKEDKQCQASHILVATEKECKDLKKQIDGGANFEELAKSNSTCPSSSKGGSLGAFLPGAMVKEFDDVCFDKETEEGKVYGPIKTQFGYHLIRLDKAALNAKKTQ